MFRPIWLIFGTRRGLRRFALNAFALFGALSALIQFYSAVWLPEEGPAHPGLIALWVAIAAVVYGTARAWPHRQVHREFGRPDITVVVKVGDLFEQDAHLVIGFNDVFDTDTTNGVVINPTTVQGQFQDRIYGNDLGRLDADHPRHSTEPSLWRLNGEPQSAEANSSATPSGRWRRSVIPTASSSASLIARCRTT